MSEVRAVLASEMEDDSVRQVQVAGRDPVALYRLAGEFYATDDVCTHGQASLAEGDIEGEDIVCPFHEGTFNIRSGAATGAPCMEPLRTYPVRVGEDGYLYIDVA